MQYEVIKDLDVSDEQSPVFGSHTAGTILDVAESEAAHVLELVEQGFLKLVGGEDTDEESSESSSEEAAPASAEEIPADTVAPAPQEQEAAPAEEAPVAAAPSVAPHPEVTEHAEWTKMAAAFPAAPAPFDGSTSEYPKCPGFLYAFCKGMEKHEAYFAPGENAEYPSGTRSFHDKNPGNLKFAGQSRAIAEDKDGFAVFKDYNDGFQALIDQVHASIRGGKNYPPIVWDPAVKSDRPANFLDFFGVYAPVPVPNPRGLATPAEYAADVLGYCKEVSGVDVPPTTPFIALLA